MKSAKKDLHIADTHPEASPNGPGFLLRRAREARNISLEQAAAYLHLAIPKVIAIECDDFTRENLVYMKGYLFTYARFLHVNEETVLQAFNNLDLAPELKIKDKIQKMHKLEKVPVGFIDPTMKRISLILLMILVVVMFLWWYVQHTTPKQTPLSSVAPAAVTAPSLAVPTTTTATPSVKPLSHPAAPQHLAPSVVQRPVMPPPSKSTIQQLPPPGTPEPAPAVNQQAATVPAKSSDQTPASPPAKTFDSTFNMDFNNH